MKRTDQQDHAVGLTRTTRKNVMMNARAGCGKTTMLGILSWEVETDNTVYLVFNTRNREEAQKKQQPNKEGERPEINPSQVIKTFNGCGHGAWMKAIGSKVVLMDDKCRDILRQIINDQTNKFTKSQYWSVYWDVMAAVKMAKSLGYVPNGKFPTAKRLLDRDQFIAALEDFDQTPGELTLELVDKVLFQSIQSAYAGVVDYNDQIYMSTLFGGIFDTYDVIFVDEYQDQNAVNHEMIRILVSRGARLFGVGDEAQNIYAFRGAKANGMATAIKQYDMEVCDLSISFRCPEKVVENARWRVPDFRWIKPGGSVEYLADLEAKNIPEDATIICRNNAPVFKLAMQLISSGRSVSIAGTDIGPRVIGIMRKLSRNENLPRASVVAAINNWRAAKLEQESKTANDIADCMMVFAEQGSDLSQAIAYAEFLFKQEGQIKMMTGHKSKGLEFDTVYLLDTHLIREDEQDRNLRYVMQTRSADRLYEITSERIKF